MDEATTDIGDPVKCARCGADTEVGAAPRAADLGNAHQCPACWMKKDEERRRELPAGGAP